MKQIITILTIVMLGSLFNAAKAQSDDDRNKLELTIVYSGKTISVGLNSVSTSLSRSSDDDDAYATIDTAKSKTKTAAKNGTFYLSMVIKKMDVDLLRVFAKREAKFDGSISIVDTYGKNPPTTMQFGGASLESYSDQFSPTSYNDSYSGANISITCAKLTMNGVAIEL